MKVIYTLLILLIPFVGFGQGWFKTITTFDESLNYGFSIKETGNNGFVLTGTTDANSGEWNIFIIKFDNEGNEQWRKIIDGGSGQDDIAFDSFYDNDLIYIIGQIEENYSFIKAFNMNGDLVNENQYNLSQIGLYNKGSSIVKQSPDEISSNILLFNNSGSYGTDGISSMLIIDDNNLDSINVCELPEFPKNGFSSSGIIDVKLTNKEYNNDGTYYISDLYFLNRALGNFGGNPSTNFYITISQLSSNFLFNYQKIYSFGGFNDDFAHDFELIDNTSLETCAIIVGSTESYGNSSYNQPVPYIIKTNTLSVYGNETTVNAIDWELILDYKGQARLITKLNNNNYLILIESNESINDPYKIIEINEFGDILCESSINLNDLIEDASIYQNSLSRLNAIIPIGNNEFLLLGNYVVESGSSATSNFDYLPNPNSFGLWNNIFLTKTECGGSISSIEDSYSKNNKNRIGLKNILGQDISKIENSILFEIFDDGTIQKKIIIE